MEGYKYPLPKLAVGHKGGARSGGRPRPARGPAIDLQTGTNWAAGLEPGLEAGHPPDATGLEPGRGRPGGRPPTRSRRPGARPRPAWGPATHQMPPAWSPAEAGLGAGHPPDEPGQDSGLGRFGGRSPTRLLRPGARPRPVWGPASLLMRPSFPVAFPTIRHFFLFAYFLLILESMLNTSKCCNQTSKQDYRTMSFQSPPF